MPKVLTEEQIGLYERDGFLVVPDMISPADISELRRVTEALVEQSRSTTEHNEIYDLEAAHSAERPLLRRIKTPEKWDPVYASMVTHPAIVGALQDLWGPSIRFQTGKLNLKVAGYGSSLEWHQDWAFYPHTNEDLAVVGIMLDDIDPENGAMMVIPGSHRGPIQDHSFNGTFVGGIDPLRSDLDFSTAQHVCGRAGSISIHHVRTVHGGAANRSGRDRRYYLLQYRAADAWPLMHDMPWDKWRESLICGEETWTPRMESLPVRIPLPEPSNQGSIYENQRELGSKYFVDSADGAGGMMS